MAFKLLDGIKVLDFTRLLPGGYATLLLADLGAQVLKVEDLAQGDYIRDMGPKVTDGNSAYFWALNRNKESMRLNIKHREGQEIVRRLVKHYDVLVEGFRPGVMERLGLGYEGLKEFNPGLIYCSLTGYGADGPYRSRAGHDINYISLAGILGLTGPADAPPVIPGIQVADMAGGGLPAAVGILAALVGRRSTGRGQYIDVAMLDGAVSLMGLYLGARLAGGEKPARGKTSLGGGRVSYGVYRTRDDRFVSLGCVEPKFWEVFCRVAGREDLLDHRFSTDETIFAVVREFFGTRTRDEIIDLFQGADSCVEPVLDVDEVLTHPQVIHREMVLEISLPGESPVRTIGPPIKLPLAETRNDTLPPAAGEHTGKTLALLGFDEETVISLRERGVVA
ncbi:MAG: CaiB/BaiF CoA-transferase family protein [Peptococcaceae bacterium]|jgi:crotonobetainyl-CoA:carnitine CoA-transferase CaiB-like acyl-CoA transferase|nr:CaiB/BaiF CoA-transferase family protein [Peptococcaceae bacterium]